MTPLVQQGLDSQGIHKRIRSQGFKLLLQAILAFVSLGAIAFVGWVVGSTQCSVFRVPSHLLDDGELPLFHESIFDTLHSSMRLTKIESVPDNPGRRAWAVEWRGNSGLIAKFWAVDSFGLENRNLLLTGIAPERRASNLVDSIVSDWMAFPSSTTMPHRKNFRHQRNSGYRSFSAAEWFAPTTGTFIVMRNGRFVIQVSSPDSLGYESALQLLSQAELILPPTLPTTGWNRFRLNQDLWAIAIAIIGSILWMWQILTSGTRAARLPASANPSNQDAVANGLRTLVEAHPALNVVESDDGLWSLIFHGDAQGRHLLSNEASSYRHEFRIRLRDHKAIVVESVKAKTRSSDGTSVARGKEYSRIVPMIDIPGGAPPIAPSEQGFRIVLDSFDPSDLRYALAYYFQLHGWGWEPRLF